MTKENDTQDEFTLIGYARVSTTEQNVQMQLDALIRYGVEPENIYQEQMSGAKKKRPAFTKAMRQLREGDTLVVWKLDRVARSVTNLLEIMKELEERGIKFRSITEGVETETPTGKMIITVMGALAQFERDLIIERTQAGVDAAKERGVKFGAKHVLQPEDIPEVWRLVNETEATKVEVAKQYGVHVQTITRRLKEYEAEQSKKDK